ncbi:MAG: cell division protein FtsI [Selenomonadaceae bacterium]|nr:cell division protein FtsI [Selenomonadaceae bacterium]
MKQNARKVACFLLICLGALMLYIGYLQFVRADFLAHHPLNRRNVQEELNIQRGRILAADGEVLAETTDLGRLYPLGEAASPVTGYLGENIGSAGLEAYANGELTGLTNDLERLGPIAQILRPEGGSDLWLTIDSEAQTAAYRGLDGAKGAAVVLDATTGAVLALVSSPAYNPSSAEERWSALVTDEDAPLLNRALQGLYPPGSTIKPLIADGALTEELTDFHEVFHCDGELNVGGGQTIRESHGAVHGSVKLGEALAKSCNVAFGTLAMRLEAKGLATTFKRFGFEEKLANELVETPSRLPDFGDLSQGELAQIGIGQSTLLVTPLRMALLMAAFTNGGAVMRPYLIDKITSAGGMILRETKPEVWYEATEAKRAATINDWLEDVVTSGTGGEAYVKGVRVTGKTGTAENGSGEDHAWFIGSAELDSRRIALAIIVENGGSGGAVAAPIARQIIQSLAR